ncbi:MAG: FecR family protein [Desulfobacterales bacterium]|nr:FecR family protein [Desulfobacterales bacterium]MDD4391369.1 FecR family protein [Desulfobacterales bacterium]
MKRIFQWHILFLLMVTAGLLTPCRVHGGVETVGGQGDSGSQITLLLGHAAVIDDYRSTIRVLSGGERVRQGERIQTANQSRIELTLPDKSYVRFDEHSIFELASVEMDRETSRRHVSIWLVSGRIWAGVSNSGLGKGEFSIVCHSVVTDAWGATCRVDIHPEGAVIVKVYDQAIKVSSDPERSISLVAPLLTGVTPSVERGKSVVSEKWSYLVRPMQEMIVSPGGAATRPFRFPAKTDMDDWVLWNQKLDASRRK